MSCSLQYLLFRELNLHVGISECDGNVEVVLVALVKINVHFLTIDIELYVKFLRQGPVALTRTAINVISDENPLKI